MSHSDERSISEEISPTIVINFLNVNRLPPRQHQPLGKHRCNWRLLHVHLLWKRAGSTLPHSRLYLQNMTICSPEWQKGNELTSQLARRIVKSNHPWVRDLTNRHHGHPLRIWYQWIIWRTTFSVYFVRGLLCVCVCVCVHRKDSFLAFFQKTFFADQLTLSALHIRTFPISTIFLNISPSSRQMEERENS